MVKAKHIPLRRCVVCRNSRPQAELIRFFKDESGHWQFDEARKSGGRGAWLCKDSPNCHKLKALGRFFRADAVRVAQQLNDLVPNNLILNDPVTAQPPAGQPQTSETTGGMNVR